MRHLDWCQSVHCPRYQSVGFPVGKGGSPSRISSVEERKLWNGAEKTAATSLASRRGIIFSSTSACSPLASSREWRKARQGRTTNSVFARLVGSSQMCSTRNGGGIFESIVGRPISSKASRRAVSKGVSASKSDLPDTCKGLEALWESFWAYRPEGLLVPNLWFWKLAHLAYRDSHIRNLLFEIPNQK